MSPTISISTVLYILIFTLSLSGYTAGQMCIEDEISIISSSPKICEGGNVTVQCSGRIGVVEIYRDGEMLYNGTSLAPELQSREVSVTSLTQGSNCLSVLLTFETVTQADAGNYTCWTNTTESNVLRLVVESQVYQHDCMINAATGPVVEKGENITCSSATGQPSWVNIDPAASLVNTESVSVTVLAFHSVNSMLLTTLKCNIVSFPTSSCPSTSTMCVDRIVVVPNPVHSYLSLTPAVKTINSGGSATYSCNTTLNIARLEIAPPTLTDAIQYTTRRLSDTNIQIAFSNITMNYTEPIVQCMLLYGDRLVASAFASVVVLEVKEVLTTVLPTTSSNVSTMVITNTTITSLTPTPMVNESTTEYSSPTTGRPTETTTIVNVRSYRIIDTRFLIIGLVIGLLVFVAIIVLCVLVFRRHARRKGDWTVSSATSRRRGQAEVASSGIEGRLEWETDINPLVVFETTAIDTLASDDDLCDDNGSLTGEDLQDSRVTRSNGYSKHISEAPAVLEFDAVIENHAALGAEASSAQVVYENWRGINRGYSPDDQSVVIHHADIPYQDSTVQQSTPNGHVVSGESNIDESVHDKADNEIDIASLNFIDATRLDASESDKDWDSGYSLGHDSILSEIDEGAINIISV